jgi:hypothetical protein
MVVRHILHYLITYPNAKDTIQGILHWWLPGGIGAWEEAVVQDALDMLVARGWLTQRQTTPSRALYGVDKAQLGEIQTFLREPEGEGEGQHGD